jgi:hypothetical protein
MNLHLLANEKLSLKNWLLTDHYIKGNEFPKIFRINLTSNRNILENEYPKNFTCQYGDYDS